MALRARTWESVVGVGGIESWILLVCVAVSLPPPPICLSLPFLSSMHIYMPAWGGNINCNCRITDSFCFIVCTFMVFSTIDDVSWQ